MRRLALAATAAASMVALAWWLGGPALAIVVLAVLGGAGAIVVTQRRASARELAATRSLERAVRAAAEAKPKAAEAEQPLSAEELLASGLLDVKHYEATVGRRFATHRDAAVHFLAEGMQSMRSANVLMDPSFLPQSTRSRYAAGDLRAVLAFLRRPPATMPPLSEYFSPSMVEAGEAELRAHPGGSLGWFLAHADDRDLLPSARLHVRWGAFRAAVEAATNEYLGEPAPRSDQPQQGVGGRGGCSVLLLDAGDATQTLTSARTAISSSRGCAVDVIVLVDRTASLDHRIALAAGLSGDERARVALWDGQLGDAVGHAAADLVCLMLEPALLRPGWIRAVRHALGTPGVAAVQALVLARDDSIEGAGLQWEGGGVSAHPLLEGRPPEDARMVKDIDLQAFYGPCILAPADRLERIVSGLDAADKMGPSAMALELSLRLRSLGEGALRCEIGARAVRAATCARDGSALEQSLTSIFERWRDRMPRPDPHPVPQREHAAPRWGLRFASVGGEAGDRWGDTPFATSLAAALRREGQEVVTYRHGANARVHEMLDDVSIVIRGKDELEPVPGAINVLWIISHPDAVSDDEIKRFDLVYAASPSWAKQRSVDSGHHIGVMLQCTDASRFRPEGVAGPSRPATFVGSVHPGRRRAVVADALAAGVELSVIGAGWQRTLPPDVLERSFVPNDELAQVYRSARVVLADHWRSMADAGFIQNRIFDALACAAPVVSDPVEGMAEALHGAVAEYRSLAQLAALCDGTEPHPAGDRSSREQIARRILSEHTFDARARSLVRDVERFRRRRRP